MGDSLSYLDNLLVSIIFYYVIAAIKFHVGLANPPLTPAPSLPTWGYELACASEG